MAVNVLDRPTLSKGGTENIGENDILPNRLPPPEEKNPGALAGATGAKTDTPKSAETVSQKSRRDAILSAAAPRHRAAAATIVAALTLGAEGSTTWHNAPLVLGVRLTAHERAELAFATLRTLDAKTVHDISADVLRAAGAPLPPFLGGMDDATHWAEWASPAELDAYCLAAFQRMAPARQAAFLRFVQGERAA